MVPETKIELIKTRKMKLGKLLLGAALFISSISFSQDSLSTAEQERECLRMQKIANDAVAAKNFKEAATYFLKGESICEPFGANNYKNLILCFGKLSRKDPDAEMRKLYTDTLIMVTNLAMEAEAYNTKNDMKTAYAYLKCSEPNYEQADFYFTRAMNTGGAAVKEGYLPTYYFNITTLYNAEDDVEKQAVIKIRLIKEFFNISKIITERGMKQKTQEQVSKMFNSIINSCEDLTPELAGFISNLPADIEAAKASLIMMIDLMESKECSDTPEFVQLIDAYLERDPESIRAIEMKAKVMESQKKYSDAISLYKKLKGLVTEDAEKQKQQYNVARCQLNSGAYKSAYNTAMSVKGELRGDALVIAAKGVAGNAPNCGLGDFERSCNFIYAVQLLEQARSNGASVGGLISSYKSRYPSSDDCFKNGNPTSFSLECYPSITVNPCQ